MAAHPDHLKLAKTVSKSGTFFCMARPADSERVHVGSSDFHVSMVDLSAEKPEFTDVGQHNSYVSGIAHTGEFLVSGGYDRQLIWWNAETHEQIRTVKAHDKWLRGVEASPDGQIIASIADDMVCRLWNAASGEKLRELHGHETLTPNHYPSMLYACTFSPDGTLLATGDKVGHVVIWEVATGEKVATFESPENYTWDPRARRHSIGGIRSLRFSPDGKSLAVGGMGKVGNIDHLGGKALVQLYDWKSGERKHVFEHDKHKGLVESLRFDHAGKWLVGGGGAHGGFLLFMDPATGKFIRDDDAKKHVHEMELSADSQTLTTACDGAVMTWTLAG